MEGFDVTISMATADALTKFLEQVNKVCTDLIARKVPGVNVAATGFMARRALILRAELERGHLQPKGES
jgi:hypothetical protein